MTVQRDAEQRLRPTSDEVIGALREAGWLLEQDTATTLERAGFHATTAKAFPDPDDPSVSREIDVHGYRQLFRSEEFAFTIGARVLAECKQSSMPYVIVGGPASEFERSRERHEQRFRFKQVVTGRTQLEGGRFRYHYTPAREYLGLDRVPGNPWEGGFLGTQMTRLDRKKTWVADNRGIFTSLVYPLAKALMYLREESRYQIGQRRPGEWSNIDFYYPLVVTSAPLFAVDVRNADLEAEQVPWATMTREIKSKTVDGRFNIDVVQSDHFERFLDERVSKFCAAVAVLAEEDPQRFVTDADHLGDS